MRRAGTVLVLALFVLGLGATAAAAKDQNTTAGAEAAFRRSFDYISNRQWGPYYRSLHPAQRALVSKDVFFVCTDKRIPEGLSVSDVDFTDSYKETVTIPGTDTKAKTTALTVKYKVKQGAAEQSTTDTIHATWVDNKWTWYMDAVAMAACTGNGR